MFGETLCHVISANIPYQECPQAWKKLKQEILADEQKAAGVRGQVTFSHELIYPLSWFR